MKLSIITATYNSGEKLEKVINCVLAQNCFDIEHIIVDNLSQDNTPERVAKYQKQAKYPVSYIREKDTGIYNALNKGIRAAKGDWVHFLHTDDLYAKVDTLNNVVLPKLQENIDLVAMSVEYVSKEPSLSRTIYPGYDQNYKFLMYPHTGSFFKRNIFTRYGYYDERYRVISDVVYIVKHYHKLVAQTYREVAVIMSGEGLSAQFDLINQYERMILYWRYLKAPWLERYKIIMSFIKQWILAKIFKRGKQ